MGVLFTGSLIRRIKEENWIIEDSRKEEEK